MKICYEKLFSLNKEFDTGENHRYQSDSKMIKISSLRRKPRISLIEPDDNTKRIDVTSASKPPMAPKFVIFHNLYSFSYDVILI